MFKKSGILGFALAAFSMLAPSMAQGAANYHHPAHYRQGYVYRGGRWVPYRGHGYPFRGGFYDHLGRWHRY
jgi:hypothetical protein